MVYFATQVSAANLYLPLELASLLLLLRAAEAPSWRRWAPAGAALGGAVPAPGRGGRARPRRGPVAGLGVGPDARRPPSGRAGRAGGGVRGRGGGAPGPVARYRLPLEALLLIFAAYAVARLADMDARSPRPQTAEVAA
jgi:hypothetical protein